MHQEAVILANGQFPERDRVIELLKESEFIVCCDGAILNLEKHNISPDIIIGDLDSIEDVHQTKYHDKIIKIDEQESNDLTKAFNYAVEKGYNKITILGATGKRDDHTLANISLLYNYNKIANTDIITDYGQWTVIDKTTTFDSYKGQQISLFSNIPDAKMYSKNLKYSLNGMVFDEIWKGTLNESTSDNFTVKFENAQVLVFRESIK